jgi:hypothetical protein
MPLLLTGNKQLALVGRSSQNSALLWPVDSGLHSTADTTRDNHSAGNLNSESPAQTFQGLLYQILLLQQIYAYKS